MNKPKALSTQDTKKLLHACAGTTNRHLGDLVEFIILSGCEKFGAMRLTWADVDFAQRQIKLQGRMGNYTIPMTSVLAKILDRRAKRSIRLDVVFWTDHQSRHGAHPRAFCDQFIPGGELRGCTKKPWTLTDLRETYKAHTKGISPVVAAILLGNTHQDNIIETVISTASLMEAAELVTESITGEKPR